MIFPMFSHIFRVPSDHPQGTAAVRVTVPKTLKEGVFSRQVSKYVDSRTIHGNVGNYPYLVVHPS